MGDRLTGEDDPQQTESRTYGDIFDEFLPEYMAMGMPYDLYWDGEYGSKKAWRIAFQRRIENEQRLADRQNWYMGQYIAAVLNAVPLLVAGLNVKKTTRLPEYPDKPFFEKAEEQKREEDRKKHEEDQTMLALAMFQEFVKNANKQIGTEQKPDRSGQ